MQFGLTFWPRKRFRNAKTIKTHHITRFQLLKKWASSLTKYLILRITFISKHTLVLYLNEIEKRKRFLTLLRGRWSWRTRTDSLRLATKRAFAGEVAAETRNGDFWAKWKKPVFRVRELVFVGFLILLYENVIQVDEEQFSAIFILLFFSFFKRFNNSLISFRVSTFDQRLWKPDSGEQREIRARVMHAIVFTWESRGFLFYLFFS